MQGQAPCDLPGTGGNRGTAKNCSWNCAGRGRAWDCSEFRGLLIYLAAAHLIYSSLICWQQTQMAQRPVKKSIRKSVADQSWPCQGDKWAADRDGIWVFSWKKFAVVDHGRWHSKNEKCNLNLSDLAVLLDPYFSFFFFPLLKIKLLDAEREIHAAPHVSEKLIQLFRNKSEFTFLATLQQKASTSGVILSIRELEHR